MVKIAPETNLCLSVPCRHGKSPDCVFDHIHTAEILVSDSLKWLFSVTDSQYLIEVKISEFMIICEGG